MSSNSITRCKPLLGTFVEISLEGDASDKALIAESSKAFSAIEKIDLAMSFHRPESELSRLNNCALLQAHTLSEEMCFVLTQALYLSKISEGHFDISVAGRLIAKDQLPQKEQSVDLSANWQDIEITERRIRFHKPLLIDLGGIAKGFAVDRAIESIDPEIKATVNAGGDLRMTDWHNQLINVQSPVNPSAVIELPMLAPAVATSATYYLDEGRSVIYPKGSTEAQQSANSYSVFAKNCLLADALTKIAFLNVPAAGDILQHFNAYARVINSVHTVRER